MDSVIIFVAKYVIYGMFIAAAVFFFALQRERKLALALYGVITAGVAFSLSRLLGSFIYTDRPFVTEHITPLLEHAVNNGFPSDHTLAAAAIAVTVFLVSKKWGGVFFVAAIAVGSARVLAHVHNVVDIVGGIGCAVIGGVVAYYVVPVLLRRFGRAVTSTNSEHIS